jgi:hypothetical protein
LPSLPPIDVVRQEVCRPLAGSLRLRLIPVPTPRWPGALLAFEDGLWVGLQNGVLNVLQVDVYTRVGGGIFALLVFGMLAYNNWKALRQEPQIPWMNAR